MSALPKAYLQVSTDPPPPAFTSAASVSQTEVDITRNPADWRVPAGQAPLPATPAASGYSQTSTAVTSALPAWARSTGATSRLGKPKRPPDKSHKPANSRNPTPPPRRPLSSRQPTPPPAPIPRPGSPTSVDPVPTTTLSSPYKASSPRSSLVGALSRPSPATLETPVTPREAKHSRASVPQAVPRAPVAPPAPAPTQTLIQAEAERLLRETVIPRLRKQYESDVMELSASLSNELLREIHDLAAGRAAAARMPNLAPDQDPPELLISLVRAMSGPRDMENAMEVLRESHRKGWRSHPDMAIAVAGQSTMCHPHFCAHRS